jgi:hypothetical protein
LISAETFVLEMKSHQHPFIAPYLKSYRNKDSIMIIMDKYEKGTLGDCLCVFSKKDLRFDENVYFFSVYFILFYREY